MGANDWVGRALSHWEGAVARKNLSLSRCASFSCSAAVSGRDKPRERPGVSLRENSADGRESLEDGSADGSALLSGVGRPAAEVVDGGWVTTGVAPGSSEDDGSEKRRERGGSESVE